MQASSEPVRPLFYPDKESVMSASDTSLESLVTSNGSFMAVTVELEDEDLRDRIQEDAV